MCFKKIFQIISKKNKAKNNVMPELTRERIAMHEAAHGVVWFLFKEKWIVNSLSIERNNLPDDRMNGALHITANFDTNACNIERANEIFAIALAGMIGQNMNMVIKNDILMFQLTCNDFNQIFDKTGCGGDFEIAKKYLPHLGKEFKVSEGKFAKYKIMDLVDMFQRHLRVQKIHKKLSLLLLEKGTLNRDELINFFETENFQKYVEDEDLDLNFFHQR